MKKRFIAIIICTCLLIFSGLGLWRQAVEKNTVYAETLANGLDIIILPSNSPLVSIQLWIRTGAINENPKNSGISHYLEHMLFKNKSSVSALEQLGGAMNGATSHDFTYYYVTLPTTELTKPIKYLCDLVFTAGFTPTEAVQEKKLF